jgi:multiple sugar transport system substrate-binding protein
LVEKLLKFGRRSLAPKRHSVFPLAILLVLISLTTGSCFSSDRPGDRTVINFMFWGGYEELDIWRELKRIYEEKYPDRFIKLEYVTGLYADKLSLALVSGTAADVFNIDDDRFKIVAAGGHLEDLTPYLERDGAELDLDDFFPGSLDTFKFNDVQWALPWDGFAVVMFYNARLFDEAGLPYPWKDWTWDDLKEMAIKLTQDKDGNGRMDQFGYFVDLGWTNLQGPIWSWGAPGVLTPDNTRCALTDPRAIEAMQFIQDLKYEHHVGPRLGEMAQLMGDTMLLTGRVAMVSGGAYVASKLRLVEGVPWDFAHVPLGPNGGRNVRCSYDGISIYGKSKHKQEAWDWVRLVLSRRAQEIIARSGRNPCIRVKDAMEFYARDDTPQHEEVVIEAMHEYGRTTPQVVAEAQMSGAFNNEFSRLDMGVADAKEVAERSCAAVDRILQDMRESFEVWQ